MTIKTQTLLALASSFLLTGALYAGDWSYSGYAEGFYTYNSTLRNAQQVYPFVYAYPDTDAIRLNHAQAELRYQSSDWFGNAGMHMGRYVEQNYAGEPSSIRPMFSASIGKNVGQTLKVEAGIFSSHIGLESAIGKDNWTLSRSMMADNSPYYEAGVRATYTPNDAWSFSALVLNGWQVISDPNSQKAFGTQVQWKPNAATLLNSSTFIGNEQTSGPAKTRYFHDFYATITLSDAWSIAGAFDLGAQDNGAGSWDLWSGGALLSQWKVQPNWNLGTRLEYFSDPNGVVSTGAVSPWSASINSDYKLSERIIWRNEAKTFWNLPQSSTEYLTALSWSFEGGF